MLIRLLIVAVFISSSATAQENVLAHLKPEHPRLMVDAQSFSQMKRQIEQTPWLSGRYAKLKQSADETLKQPPVHYELSDGVRLLSISRKALERISTLAIVFHVEKDDRYKQRLWTELQAISQFSDWHPKHFLDTAEMTAAAAIGYDWMYDQWSPDQRKLVRDAIVKNGLNAGMLAYTKGINGMFVKAAMNWNTVCNGGLALGAMAIAEDEPKLAADVLSRGIKSAPTCLKEFAPDGAWVEGPGYWGYTTIYESIYLDSLRTALGSDFGLGDFPGMDQAGWFPVYLNGATDRPFDFADSHDSHVEVGSQMLWLSRRYHEPRYAEYEMEQKPYGELPALEMIWAPGIVHEDWTSIPPDKYFRKAEVATMRDRWKDPNAWFVAIKAGSNAVNHSHLDIGSFILEAHGIRWGIDMGADNYNMPGYFDFKSNRRWTYYRLRAEAHNTLLINPGKGPDQDPKGAGVITSFDSTPAGVDLVADLSGAYPGAKVTRSVHFERGKSVTIHDEVSTSEPQPGWWMFHTRATPTLSSDGKTVTLSEKGNHMTMSLKSGGMFEIASAAPLASSPNPPGQGDNSNVRTVRVKFESPGVVEVRFGGLSIEGSN